MCRAVPRRSQRVDVALGPAESGRPQRERSGLGRGVHGFVECTSTGAMQRACAPLLFGKLHARRDTPDLGEQTLPGLAPGWAGSRGWRLVRGCPPGLAERNLLGTVFVEQDDEEVAGLPRGTGGARQPVRWRGAEGKVLRRLNFSSPKLDAVEHGDDDRIAYGELKALWR